MKQPGVLKEHILKGLKYDPKRTVTNPGSDHVREYTSGMRLNRTYKSFIWICSAYLKGLLQKAFGDVDGVEPSGRRTESGAV